MDLPKGRTGNLRVEYKVRSNFHSYPLVVLVYHNTLTRGSHTGRFKLLSSGCFKRTGFGHSLMNKKSVKLYIKKYIYRTGGLLALLPNKLHISSSHAYCDHNLVFLAKWETEWPQWLSMWLSTLELVSYGTQLVMTFLCFGGLHSLWISTLVSIFMMRWKWLLRPSLSSGITCSNSTWFIHAYNHPASCRIRAQTNNRGQMMAYYQFQTNPKNFSVTLKYV